MKTNLTPVEAELIHSQLIRLQVLLESLSLTPTDNWNKKLQEASEARRIFFQKQVMLQD